MHDLRRNCLSEGHSFLRKFTLTCRFQILFSHLMEATSLDQWETSYSLWGYCRLKLTFPTSNPAVVAHILIWDKGNSQSNKADDIFSFTEIYILPILLRCTIYIGSSWLKVTHFSGDSHSNKNLRFFSLTWLRKLSSVRKFDFMNEP